MAESVALVINVSLLLLLSPFDILPTLFVDFDDFVFSFWRGSRVISPLDTDMRGLIMSPAVSFSPF